MHAAVENMPLAAVVANHHDQMLHWHKPSAAPADLFPLPVVGGELAGVAVS